MRSPKAFLFERWVNGKPDRSVSCGATLLHHTCLRLWGESGPHYALYSCRHQFILDAKSIFSREEVAALAGHATDVTAQDGYAKRRKAKSSGICELPTPDPADVARVRRCVDKKFEQLDEIALRRRVTMEPSITAELDGAREVVQPPLVDKTNSRSEPTIDDFPEPPQRTPDLDADKKKRAATESWLQFRAEQVAQLGELKRWMDQENDDMKPPRSRPK